MSDPGDFWILGYQHQDLSPLPHTPARKKEQRTSEKTAGGVSGLEAFTNTQLRVFLVNLYTYSSLGPSFLVCKVMSRQS